MRLTHIRIKNFRAHSDTELHLHQLGCLIGENNAGKSSVLHALQFILEDKKLNAEDFRDATLPVSVELQIEDIDEGDLLRVDDEGHRTRIRDILAAGKITIIRSQALGEKAESKYLKLRPSDPLLSEESLASEMKGKKGTQLHEAVVKLIPKMNGRISSQPTQKEIREERLRIITELDRTELELASAPFPTGIAQAVKPLLPSVIYIEAVKEASVEAKATGTSAFGKLLGLLFDTVSEQFNDIDEQFQAVSRKLSRLVNDDGSVVDDRLPAVKNIESKIQEYIQASFPGVSLRMHVPAPTLALLLTGAELLVNDGHEGTISSKGDGLQRTVLFALLRAYTSIRHTGLQPQAGTSSPRPSYILLFEEPELYLHPRAQRQLMAALTTFSQDHQVVVTTHSPGFFHPGTQGFTRLQKSSNGVSVNTVDLALSHRDAYQIVQHDNNEAAFFSQKVVLVEGDSDTLIYPHLSKLINPRWDNVEKNIMFVKINGKGNIKRYREFFASFDLPIHVITDLDALVRGFEQLTDDKNTKTLRSNLMVLIDDAIPGNNDINGKRVREATGTRTSAELWRDAQLMLNQWKEEPSDGVAQDLTETLTRLFAVGQNEARLRELMDPSSETIADARDAVIKSLASESVHVLKRGDLEKYCKSSSGKDKVESAINFCQNIRSVEQLRSLHGNDAAEVEQELSFIFSSIYG